MFCRHRLHRISSLNPVLCRKGAKVKKSVVPIVVFRGGSILVGMILLVHLAGTCLMENHFPKVDYSAQNPDFRERNNIFL